jgi:hypothetical protein
MECGGKRHETERGTIKDVEEGNEEEGGQEKNVRDEYNQCTLHACMEMS